LAVPVVDGHQQVTFEFRELPVDLRRGVLHCMTIHHSVGPGKQGKYDWLGILGANNSDSPPALRHLVVPAD
jgi:hypothetical protein